MSEEKDNTVEKKDSEVAELEARLKAAVGSKARFDEARQTAELRRRVEEAERVAADLEVLEGLIAKHGEIGDRLAVLHTSAGMVVVKRPNPLHYRRFQDQKDQQTEHVATLVRTCLVHPSATGFETICNELPATLLQVADLVASLAGVGKGRVEGK